LSTRVAELIERHIATEQLQPGDRLPSGRDLAERFSVSRTVVRDALSTLEQQGLVELRPGSGVYVADGGSDAVAAVLGLMLRQEAVSYQELAEVRELLEIHSAHVAATRATAKHLEAMRATIMAMASTVDPVSFVEADIAFHEHLAEASGNRVLVAFLKSLRPLLFQGMLAGTRLAGARDSAIREHSAIVEAIANQDDPSAQRLMTDHVHRSYREWQEAEGKGVAS
jgi:DNA-binding FadR family transcriptional regulator